MNTDQYKRRLVAMEQEVLKRLKREGENARESSDGSARDIGDESADDERKGTQLTEADADSTVLNQVREALGRIEDGTFGKCAVDGQGIEEKRLAAIPWTPYCLKHEQELEEQKPQGTPSL